MAAILSRPQSVENISVLYRYIEHIDVILLCHDNTKHNDMHLI